MNFSRGGCRAKESVGFDSRARARKSTHGGPLESERERNNFCERERDRSSLQYTYVCVCVCVFVIFATEPRGGHLRFKARTRQLLRSDRGQAALRMQYPALLPCVR